MKNLQKYEINVLQYSNTQFVQSNCNSITFYNVGSSTLLIEQSIPLANGQTFTITGNENEICVKQFLITFTGGGENNAIIVKKNYTD
jgi:hypothetical protein